MKLFGGRVSTRDAGGAAPGEVIAIEHDGMHVACGAGVVQITGVHPAGKRRIAPEEWLRGRGIAVGERLS